MRKIKSLLCVSILFFIGVTAGMSQGTSSGQASGNPDEIAKLEKLSKDVLANFSAGAYDEALKSANEALTLSIKLNGEQSKPVASMYFNLGAIYGKKKQLDTALENFQKALDIYHNSFPDEKTRRLGVLKEMGVIYYNRQDKQGEKIFLEALGLSMELNGENNKQTVDLLGYLAFIYLRKNDELNAESYLYRAREGALEAYGVDSDLYETLSDTYSCFSSNLADGKVKDIVSARRAKNAPPTPPSSKIINGRAQTLAKPQYPLNTNGQGGRISVKVMIDESGNVVKARAYCGPAVFWKTSEAAALKSKFSPTLLSGMPVKVSGIIVYNFEFVPLKPKN